MVHDKPAFGEMFIAHLLIRNSKVEEDLVDQLFNSSEKRLARTLLMLANFGKAGGPQPITTKISHKMLAEIIGTTRPCVSHFMNKFRTLGFLEYNGKLKVNSSLLNALLRKYCPGQSKEEGRLAVSQSGPAATSVGRVCKLRQCLQSTIANEG